MSEAVIDNNSNEYYIQRLIFHQIFNHICNRQQLYRLFVNNINAMHIFLILSILLNPKRSKQNFTYYYYFFLLYIIFTMFGVQN